MGKIRVLSAAALKRGLNQLAEAYGRDRGVEVEVTFSTGPIISEKMKSGDVDADIIVAPEALMGKFAERNQVDPASLAPIGGVRAAIAVRGGTPAPDISTRDAVSRALLDADLIVLTTATSGRRMEDMITGLGIAEQVAARIARFPNGEEAMRALAAHESPRGIGFCQSSALREHERLGVKQVGPLPEEIAKMTNYVAGITAGARARDGAASFLAFLGNEDSRRILHACGIE